MWDTVDLHRNAAAVEFDGRSESCRVHYGEAMPSTPGPGVIRWWPCAEDEGGVEEVPAASAAALPCLLTSSVMAESGDTSERLRDVVTRDARVLGDLAGVGQAQLPRDLGALGDAVVQCAAVPR